MTWTVTTLGSASGFVDAVLAPNGSIYAPSYTNSAAYLRIDPDDSVHLIGTRPAPLYKWAGAGIVGDTVVGVPNSDGDTLLIDTTTETTSSAGGAGGASNGGGAGSSGSSGAGGAGGTSSGTRGGGSGGGGYYGGGGGGGAQSGRSGGGGGGGSSYTGSGASDVTHAPGYSTGNGSCRISW